MTKRHFRVTRVDSGVLERAHKQRVSRNEHEGFVQNRGHEEPPWEKEKSMMVTEYTDQQWAKNTTEERREALKGSAIGDLGAVLVYYDRQHDNVLPGDTIQRMLAAGEVTLDELRGWLLAMVEAVMFSYERGMTPRPGPTLTEE